MAEEIWVGAHRIRVVEDDSIEIAFHGRVSGEDMAVIVREHDGRMHAHGRLFVLSDLRDVGYVSPEARRVLGQGRAKQPVYWTAYLVSQFHVRVMLELLIRAGRMLNNSGIVPRFCDDLEEARAWLAEQRRTHGR
jgi:hypothetical protein